MGKYIKRFSQKDRDVIEILAKCGKASSNQLTSNVDSLKEKRLFNLCREGILQKEIIATSRNTNEVCYKLTKEGKNFARDTFNIQSFYKSNGNYHDLILAEKYLSLTQSERETWQTETDLQLQFYKHLDELKESDRERYDDVLERYESREISICDATYVSDSGEVIVFEAVTNSYGNRNYQAKQAYCQEMKLPDPTYQRL